MIEILAAALDESRAQIAELTRERDTARKAAERVDRLIGYPQQHLDALDTMTAQVETLRAALLKIAKARVFINGLVISACPTRLCIADDTVVIAEAALSSLPAPSRNREDT